MGKKLLLILNNISYSFSTQFITVLFLTISLLLPNFIIAQNDYKISTEGFVFKNPTKENVTLAVYFLVNNILS